MRCMIDILNYDLMKSTNILMSSVGATLNTSLQFISLFSSCSCDTTNKLNLPCNMSRKSGEFSTKFWISRSTCCWSSGLFTTQSNIGFLCARDFIHVLKNLSLPLISSAASSLSSLRIDCPQSKSCWSGPMLVIVPPSVNAHLMALQIE